MTYPKILPAHAALPDLLSYVKVPGSAATAGPDAVVVGARVASGLAMTGAEVAVIGAAEASGAAMVGVAMVGEGSEGMLPAC